jgi:hypothetical protein
MNRTPLNNQSLLRRTVVEIAHLPDDDLEILLEIVNYLKEQRAANNVLNIRRAAKQRAKELSNQSREELVTQLLEVGKRIRHQAASSGTVFEGDWEGD